MSDTALWTAWRAWMTVGTVIILVVVSLLMVILRSARQIYADALRALTAIQAIRIRTQEVRGVGRTNDVLREILVSLQEIEQKSRTLVEARARAQR